MKINHDLRHRITVVEAQGKALIEQKVELEAYLQTKEQEMGSLRAELGKLREKLQGEDSQNGEEIKVRDYKSLLKAAFYRALVFITPLLWLNVINVHQKQRWLSTQICKPQQVLKVHSTMTVVAWEPQ